MQLEICNALIIRQSQDFLIFAETQTSSGVFGGRPMSDKRLVQSVVISLRVKGKQKGQKR